MKPIFELNLEYHPDTSPLAGKGKLGEHVGSGGGTADGRQIKGEVRWSLFENSSGLFCDFNLIGVIRTDDDAEVRFDALGFFRRPDEAAETWKASASVTFQSADQRYAWLTALPAAWQGEFNMQSYQHRYRVFA